MNELKVFTNERLGEIRAVEIDGKPYFIGKDIAERLGYSNTRDALSKHVDSEDKAIVAIHDGSQKRNVVAINESGVYALIFGSKLDKAKEFKHWVTSEVLPEIRRTGGYNSQQSDEYKQKRLEVMMINAKAKLMKEQNKRIELMMKNPNVKAEFKEDMPNIIEKVYTATEVGEILGISANKVGRLANKYDLKTEGEYGFWFKEETKTGKEVKNYQYNDKAVEKLREILGE